MPGVVPAVACVAASVRSARPEMVESVMAFVLSARAPDGSKEASGGPVLDIGLLVSGS